MDTPVKDVNCLEEPLVPLRFHMRSYSTDTVQEYREMIAPSFPTKLYHFDEGILFCKQHLGIVGTGGEPSNNNDNVTLDLQPQQSPLPSPPETTHCRPQIYSYTEPTQAPPSQCPPKQPLKKKNTKLSSEKLPSQKRQWNGPPGKLLSSNYVNNIVYLHIQTTTERRY